MSLERCVRWGFTAFFVVWATAYQLAYGATWLLWYCCFANVLTLIGLHSRRAIWCSMAAVSVLPISIVWTIDLACALALGVHPIGGTEYMLDPSRPLAMRALSLYHFATPLVIVWALRRSGYDRRALVRQTVVGWTLLAIGWLAFDPRVDTDDALVPIVDGVRFDRDYDVNFAHGLWGRPPAAEDWSPFLLVLLGYPLLVHLSSHLLVVTLLPPVRRANA